MSAQDIHIFAFESRIIGLTLLNFHRSESLIFPPILKQFYEVQNHVDLIEAVLGNQTNGQLDVH